VEDVTARVTQTSGIARSVSRGCGVCHSQELSLWISHPHSRFLVDPARDPRGVLARWGKAVPGWKLYVNSSFGKEDVAKAFGVLQIQVLFRRERDGHRLFPAQWNIRERRWEPLAKGLERVRRERGTWEQLCAGCHVIGFDVVTGGYAEANAACSACHGNGAAHAESGGRKAVLRPSTLTPQRRSEVCGSCHSRGQDRKTGRPYPVGFVAGTSLDEVFALEVPSPGKATDFFWPDGTERQAYMEYQGFVQSRHFKAGLSCTTCHLAHGSDYTFNLRRKTVDLCENCHGSTPVEAPVHRGHPAGKATCVDCHMAVINPSPGEAHVHTHTFRFLDPSGFLSSGMPNSCTSECHPGRDLRWAAGVVRSWREKK
jgi:predicted CXXCH cytochrome family protein